MIPRIAHIALLATTLAAAAPLHAEPESRPWPDILARAKGQTVYWNAWG